MLAPPILRTAEYAREIRHYLLGRLERAHDDAIVDPRTDEPPARCLPWWIFEGKRYSGIEGALIRSWPYVERQILRLRAAHSPRSRVVPAPDGEVDWLASAMVSVTSGMEQYVARSTALGLGDEERAALEGWVVWIAGQWADYVGDVGVPPQDVVVLPSMPHAPTSRPTRESLRRWAHVSRRSRWPLLRNIVAESLRCVLEDEEIDRLPLPTKHDRLFELVCGVRILKALIAGDRRIRWLDSHDGGNTIELGDITWWFQHYVGNPVVHASNAYPKALVRALRRHAVSTAGFVDMHFDFRAPRNGFSSLIIECKSGNEPPAAAIEQMRFYREALRTSTPGPSLVLGVVETGSACRPEAVVALREETSESPRTDVYAFASADEIGDVLRAVGLTSLRPE